MILTQLSDWDKRARNKNRHTKWSSILYSKRHKNKKSEIETDEYLILRTYLICRFSVLVLSTVLAVTVIYYCCLRISCSMYSALCTVPSVLWWQKCQSCPQDLMVRAVFWGCPGSSLSEGGTPLSHCSSSSVGALTAERTRAVLHESHHTNILPVSFADCNGGKKKKKRLN